MRDDAVLRRALPLGRGLGPVMTSVGYRIIADVSPSPVISTTYIVWCYITTLFDVLHYYIVWRYITTLFDSSFFRQKKIHFSVTYTLSSLRNVGNAEFIASLEKIDQNCPFQKKLWSET